MLVDKAGNVWLGIGDVSGHGVTPGLIMMIAQTIKTTIATHMDVSPKEMVNMLNTVLYYSVHERLNADHLMTFTTLKYHGHGRFEHAGAHLELIIYRQVFEEHVRNEILTLPRHYAMPHID